MVTLFDTSQTGRLAKDSFFALISTATYAELVGAMSFLDSSGFLRFLFSLCDIDGDGAITVGDMSCFVWRAD